MTATDQASGPLPAAMLVRVLERRGAGEAPHMRSSVLGHLRSVHDILVRWGTPDWLAAAGLFHGFYGTDRLDQALGTAADRPVLQRLLGPRAAELVWLYGSCDFAFLRAAMVRTGHPAYRDWRTGEELPLTRDTLLPLCELIAANEIELASESPTYRQKKLALFQEMVACWGPVLSPAALAGVGHMLAGQGAAAPAGCASASSSSSTARVAASE